MVVKRTREMMRVALERGGRHVMLRVQRSVLRDSGGVRDVFESGGRERLFGGSFAKHIHRCPERLSAT